MLEMWFKALQDLSPNQEILTFHEGIGGLFLTYVPSFQFVSIFLFFHHCSYVELVYLNSEKVWRQASIVVLSIWFPLPLSSPAPWWEFVDLRQAVYRLQMEFHHVVRLLWNFVSFVMAAGLALYSYVKWGCGIWATPSDVFSQGNKANH